MKPSRAAALQAKAFQEMADELKEVKLLLARMDKKLNSLVRASKAPAKKPASK